MKHTARIKQGQDIASRKPLYHVEQHSVNRRQPSEADRSFIQSMNELVEKHGTITDDEFFRVL
ncbi:TPA: hypothetical protein QCI71_004238 [Enterobacter chuandaensis]|uniref:Uncharacterized protein n=1 Tax=Enterobacter nematophilus TaxID=2994648 RepID=A0ABT3VSF8_9ENTR|nr:hypothetical protein [Enterobacter nematophilus]MCX5572503.1 hypothetical protein [Enterobacter nematophilus]HDR2623302.1 hypothetical protein [Enterobacter chuandaensis]